MKVVAVSGAGGFIGAELCKQLLLKDYVVYGLDISYDLLERFRDYPNFFPVVVDFSKYKQLADYLPENLDVFFHMAWNFNNMRFYDYETQIKNAIAGCDAVEAMDAHKCKKFVFAGSMNEYEINKYITMNEIQPRYTYVYAISKFMAESISKTICYNNNKMQFCVGRIAMVYGPGNNLPNIANVAINNLVKNIPLKLVEGKHPYDLIYFEDVASAFIAIGEKGRNMNTYYIGHRKLKSFKENIEDFARIINPDCPRLYGAYPDKEPNVDYSKIDLDALYRDTGFECKADLTKSVLKTAEWIVEKNK